MRGSIPSVDEAIYDMKEGYIYILTDRDNNVLYTGVTSDLIKRIYEHKHKLVDGFTKKYYANKLVYYEMFENIEDAIAREKQIKGGSREKKLKLIRTLNPKFLDLYDELDPKPQIASSLSSSQ